MRPPVSEPIAETPLAPPSVVAPEQRNLAFAAILSALLLTAIDQNIVGNVLPRIVRELGQVHLYAWVISGYLLTSTIAVPIAGKLGDLHGRKIVLLGGITVLSLGGLLAALADSMEAIVAMRALQGIGAGFLQAGAFAAIGDLLAPSERGRYTGLFSAAYAFASMVGPLLGGLIADRLGWRWVFLLDLPLGIFASWAILRGLTVHRSRSMTSTFDWRGAFAFVGTIVPMMLAFPSGKAATPDTLTILRVPLLVFAASMVGLFLFVEKRAAEPLVPLHLFRRPVFSVAIAVAFLSGGGLYAAGGFVPLYVQNVLGKTVTQAGIVFVPMMVTLVLGNIIGGQWLSRRGSYRWLSVAGAVIASSGLFVLSRLDAQSTMGQTMACLAVFGVGLGITLPMLTIAAQNAVEHQYLGVATSLMQFARTLAGSVGVASFGAVLAARMDRGMAVALSDVFLMAGALVGLGGCVAFFLRDIPLRKTNA
jgi:EmrB/QacA subfamily drug resistance transporter